MITETKLKQQSQSCYGIYIHNILALIYVSEDHTVALPSSGTASEHNHRNGREHVLLLLKSEKLTYS